MFSIEYFSTLFLSLSTAPGNRLPFLPSPAVGGTNTGTGGHIRFPRGAVNRNTFHGGQVRRHPMFNGPNASPGMQDSMERNRNSMSFFGKLSSKFQRRLVTLGSCPTPFRSICVCFILWTYFCSFVVFFQISLSKCLQKDKNT